MIVFTEMPTSVAISISQNAIVMSCRSPVEGGLMTCCMIQSNVSGPFWKNADVGSPRRSSVDWSVMCMIRKLKLSLRRALRACRAVTMPTPAAGPGAAPGAATVPAGAGRTIDWPYATANASTRKKQSVIEKPCASDLPPCISRFRWNLLPVGPGIMSNCSNWSLMSTFLVALAILQEYDPGT